MKTTFLLSVLFILSSFATTTNNLECGDLLALYAEKPQNVEFIKCIEKSGQTKFVAKYKVIGGNSEEVEQILIKNYKIGKLKFVCCGWESNNGKNGYIESNELKEVNPNYTLEISMYGNAEKQNEKDEFYIELDRSKIEFYVIVKLLEV